MLFDAKRYPQRSKVSVASSTYRLKSFFPCEQYRHRCFNPRTIPSLAPEPFFSREQIDEGFYNISTKTGESSDKASNERKRCREHCAAEVDNGLKDIFLFEV